MPVPLLAALIAMQAPALPDLAKPGEIVVEGRVLTRMEAERIVRAVGRPESTGGFESQYARWQRAICVSVAGFPSENGQFIADDIGQTAQGLGLEAQGPGCQPNVVIVATTDPAALIAKMRTRRPMLVSGQNHSVLDRIQKSHDAIRWIGATRFGGADGQGPSPRDGPSGSSAAPVFDSYSGGSRLNPQVRTYLERMTVIVDVNQIDGLNYQQLADYLAFVTLAQVKPGRSPIDFGSILSIFPRGGKGPAALTSFDRAYLAGLYSSNPGALGSAQRAAISNAVRRDTNAAPPPAPPDTVHR